MRRPGMKVFEALPKKERERLNRVAFGVSEFFEPGGVNDFLGYDYWNWLGEDGVKSAAAYKRFDDAVKKVVGKELYDDASTAARLSPLVECIALESSRGADPLTKSIYRAWKKLTYS